MALPRFCFRSSDCTFRSRPCFSAGCVPHSSHSLCLLSPFDLFYLIALSNFAAVLIPNRDHSGSSLMVLGSGRFCLFTILTASGDTIAIIVLFFRLLFNRLTNLTAWLFIFNALPFGSVHVFDFVSRFELGSGHVFGICVRLIALNRC